MTYAHPRLALFSLNLKTPPIIHNSISVYNRKERKIVALDSHCNQKQSITLYLISIIIYLLLLLLLLLLLYHCYH